MNSVSERVSSGVSGLDDILNGGLIPNRSYMVRGRPGTGKTILGIHFLMAGVAKGETTLLINLEESREDIRANAKELGFDIDQVDFLDLSPDSDIFTQERSYDIFPPEDVEQDPLTEKVTTRVEELEPSRVFIDPLTQLRYLSSDKYRFRKQVLAFMNFLQEHGSTVFFASEETETEPDDDLQFICDGKIQTNLSTRGRSITVPKFRGGNVKDGIHSMEITGQGIEVYPVLIPETYGADFDLETISSGVPELDSLLGGGLERGTVTIISGPTGVGKTTTGVQFMKEAAGRGERSVIYTFEETRGTFLTRCESVNIPVREMMERGTLSVNEIEPLALSAAEFADEVIHEVEDEGADIVMIDGIEGYRMSLRGEKPGLSTSLHALGRYLKNKGVTVILVEEIDTITGEFRATEYGVSYLGDNIIYLQYLEIQGELRKAIGVLKKRVSDFERAMREFELTSHGIKVGDQLTGLRGILSGTPEWPNEELGGVSDDD